MGLSGRKVKQRIGHDPRNLSWADDASRFGQNYLAKFGWDASKGLGAAGEGRTSAVQVAQKLDMLGIGMQHQKDPDGIAWKQNRDFENLLRRLNAGGEAGGGAGTGVVVEGGFHRATEGLGEEAAEEAEEGKKKKKKKRGAEGEEDNKERKKRKKSKSGEEDAAEEGEMEPVPPPVPIAAPAPVRAPPRAHRARFIAAKRMAASNAAALSEILGIPSSSSSTLPTTPASPSPLPTPAPEPEPMPELQTLTIATQSVDDYFRAKLAAKAGAQPLRPSSAPAPSYQREDDDEDEDAPRAGLGLGTARGGIEASSKFAAMFGFGRGTVDTPEEPPASATAATPTAGGADEDEVRAKSEKRRAKEARRWAKEERRRKRVEAEEAAAAAAELPDDEPPVEATKKKKRRMREEAEARVEYTPAPTPPDAADGSERKSKKHRKLGSSY